MYYREYVLVFLTSPQGSAKQRQKKKAADLRKRNALDDRIVVEMFHLHQLEDALGLPHSAKPKQEIANFKEAYDRHDAEKTQNGQSAEETK
jgi:hypothetical protein